MSPLAQAQCYCPSIGMVGTDPTNSREERERIALMQMALPASEGSDDHESTELVEKIVEAIRRVKAARKTNEVCPRLVTQRLGEVAAYCNQVIDQLEARAAERKLENPECTKEIEAAALMLEDFRRKVYQKLCELKKVGETGGPQELAETMAKLAELDENPLASLSVN